MILTAAFCDLCGEREAGVERPRTDARRHYAMQGTGSGRARCATRGFRTFGPIHQRPSWVSTSGQCHEVRLATARVIGEALVSKVDA